MHEARLPRRHVHAADTLSGEAGRLVPCGLLPASNFLQDVHRLCPVPDGERDCRAGGQAWTLPRRIERQATCKHSPDEAHDDATRGQRGVRIHYAVKGSAVSRRYSCTTDSARADTSGRPRNGVARRDLAPPHVQRFLRQVEERRLPSQDGPQGAAPPRRECSEDRSLMGDRTGAGRQAGAGGPAP